MVFSAKPPQASAPDTSHNLNNATRQKQLLWWLLIVAAVTSPFLSLFFGAAELSAQTIYTCVIAQCDDPINQVIFWEIRMPRIFAGFLVGAGLAIAGATLQNVTRNSLADPYLFGPAQPETGAFTSQR